MLSLKAEQTRGSARLERLIKLTPAAYHQLALKVLREDMPRVLAMAQSETDASGLQRRTGNLISSERVTALEGSTSSLIVEFGFDESMASYGKYHERGTSRLRARRFLRAARTRYESQALYLIARQIERYLDGQINP